MKRGFSLIETTVVMGIFVAGLFAVWASLSHLGSSEQSTDREATRALLQARLAEMLQRDLRSALSVSAGSDQEYHITRWVVVDDRLEQRVVTWKRIDNFKISRTVAPDPPQEFNFKGLLNADSPGLTFRLEPLNGVVFARP